jgi:RimJ/RimL family protein N-acetyltransferase
VNTKPIQLLPDSEPADPAAGLDFEPFLETERLALRELTVEDAGIMLALLTDERFIRYVGDRGVRTVEEAQQYLKDGPIDSYRRLGYGLYLAVRKADGLPAGICGLVKRDALPDPDLGYALLPGSRGAGLAREAGEAVVRHARDVLKLPRLLAIVTPSNYASIRILHRLGFRVVGPLRLAPGEPELRLFACQLQTRAGGFDSASIRP